MSLETGEDTRLEMAFSDYLSYDEFGQNARFTYMYNGVLHENVSAVLHGGDWRIVGDEETIIDVLHWEDTSRHGTTSLIIGRHDWKLIAITYGDDYQLQPQDLVGLVLSNSNVVIANAILSGNETPFIFYGHLITAQYDSASSSAILKLNRCSDNDQQCVHFGTEEYGEDLSIVTSYSCGTINSNLAQYFKSYMEVTIGLQPSQIATVTIGDFQTNLRVPIGDPAF